MRNNLLVCQNEPLCLAHTNEIVIGKNTRRPSETRGKTRFMYLRKSDVVNDDSHQRMRDDRSRESGLSSGEIRWRVINCVVRLDEYTDCMYRVGIAIRNMGYTSSAESAVDTSRI